MSTHLNFLAGSWSGSQGPAKYTDHQQGSHLNLYQESHAYLNAIRHPNPVELVGPPSVVVVRREGVQERIQFPDNPWQRDEPRDMFPYTLLTYCQKEKSQKQPSESSSSSHFFFLPHDYYTGNVKASSSDLLFPQEETEAKEKVPENKWQHDALEELEDIFEEATEDGIRPPLEGAVDLAERLIRSLTPMRLPPASVFPDNHQSVSIQIGSSRFGGTILLTCFGDESTTFHIACEKFNLRCRYPDASDLPDNLMVALLSELYG